MALRTSEMKPMVRLFAKSGSGDLGDWRDLLAYRALVAYVLESLTSTQPFKSDEDPESGSAVDSKPGRGTKVVRRNTDSVARKSRERP